MRTKERDKKPFQRHRWCPAHRNQKRQRERRIHTSTASDVMGVKTKSLRVAQSSRTTESRRDAAETRFWETGSLSRASHQMPWTARGELQNLQKEKKIRGRTHIEMCKPTFLPSQHKNNNKHGNDSLQKKQPATSQSSNSMIASSNTEAPQETEPDWTSGDTALEMYLEMKLGKHVFQKICRVMYAFRYQRSQKRAH